MSALDDLRDRLSTPVLTATDPDYPAAARKWGPPAAPDVLVQPDTTSEIGSVLAWAAAEGVEVAVRSGGHGPWAPRPGGLLIDLGRFTEVAVDGDRVRVGAGLTWGEVADALGPHGLALSSGDNRTVGVGGNALGAGVGWLLRSVGLAVDQLVGAEVVAADGRVVTASEEEHPDLFFALRGGGGNFGVVTRLDFHARHLPDVVFGTVPIDPAELGGVIRGVRDAMRDAPRELGVTLVTFPAPQPGLPPVLEVVWAGADEAAARTALAPLLAVRGVGTPDLSVVPYRSTLSELPAPEGAPPRTAGSNGIFVEVSDERVDRVIAAIAAAPSTMFDVRFLGGSVADVPPDRTALAWRDADAMLHWIVMLPGDASDAELHRAAAAWAPVGEGADAICGTFTEQTGPEVLTGMYPPETLARLRAVKRDWDPHNLFRRNHNIAPA